MFKPNPTEFELPYEEALRLGLHGEWIAERKLEGVRAILDDGLLKSPHSQLSPPSPLPSRWRLHTLDGCVVGNLYYVFDILQKDGKDVRTRPMHERIKLLRSLDLPNWCRLVPRGKSIGEFLEAVIRDGGTGIVLKNLLEPYGNASWIKIERPMVQEAVITALDETALSARIARFQRGQLVDCGITFLGSLIVEAQIGQVIDVDMRGCTPGSRAGRPRFVRFRADRILLDADASGRQACQPGKMIRLRSHTHSPTATQPVNHAL